jgi:hypothetical protein
MLPLLMPLSAYAAIFDGVTRDARCRHAPAADAASDAASDAAARFSFSFFADVAAFPLIYAHVLMP